MCGWKGQLNEMGKKANCREMVRTGLTEPRLTPSFHQMYQGPGVEVPKHEGGDGLRRHYGQLRLWGAEKARAQSGTTGKGRSGLYYAILLHCPSLGFPRRWQGAAL